MPVASWPATLPQTILMSGYSQQMANTTLRSQPDAGPAMVRRRFTAGVQPVSAKLLISKTQLGYLRTFYDTTLLAGSLRFSWTDPITTSAVEMRFTEPPTWTVASNDYVQVDMALEILP